MRLEATQHLRRYTRFVHFGFYHAFFTRGCGFDKCAHMEERGPGALSHGPEVSPGPRGSGQWVLAYESTVALN